MKNIYHFISNLKVALLKKSSQYSSGIYFKIRSPPVYSLISKLDVKNNSEFQDDFNKNPSEHNGD